MAATLSDQLAILGVELPSWPNHDDALAFSSDWMHIAQCYADGIRLWRARLRNASTSTKTIVDHLFKHTATTGGQNAWDQWLSAALSGDVADGLKLDRWSECIDLIQSLPLLPAQILGGSLALAEAKQLAGAILGVKHLLSNPSVSRNDVLAICSGLVANANTDWWISEAQKNVDTWHTALQIHHGFVDLVRHASEWHTSGSQETNDTCKHEVLRTLDGLLILLGEDEKWSELPYAEAKGLVALGELGEARMLLQANLPLSIESKRRDAYARMLISRILAEKGEWQAAVELHEAAFVELEAIELTNENQRAQLGIIRSETELLSHELSIALQTGGLMPRKDSDEKQQLTIAHDSDNNKWKSLSRSQLGQDLWVLEKLDWKKGGYFVEFGATDGVLLSNTWLLEKYFQWQGICAEPNPKFFKQLKKNRKCHVSPACVHKFTGEKMQFVMADAFGGLVGHTQEDGHQAKRSAYQANKETMEVETVSLTDLLDEFNAPSTIDYLSIDTEGSELTILEGVNWERHRFRCITVEHNFTPQRQLIEKLLTDLGYEKTDGEWDDWYFHEHW